MSRNTKKATLFQRGTEAIQRALGVDGVYLCPICNVALNKAALAGGDLTIEHVPPASVGGKGITLTCKTCNNSAGFLVDAAISRRAKNTRFVELVASPTSTHVDRAFLTIAGERLTVEISRTKEGSILLAGIPSVNDPAAISRAFAHMERLAQEQKGYGEQYRVTSLVRYNPRLAAVGDLRAAFLAAFAALGYTYAFSRQTIPVRMQICRPTETIINHWAISPSSLDDTRYAIWIIDSPSCLVVRMGDVAVLLPGLDAADNFYETMESIAQDKTAEFNAKIMEWPTTMNMILDFPGPGEELESPSLEV